MYINNILNEVCIFLTKKPNLKKKSTEGNRMLLRGLANSPYVVYIRY